MREIIYSPESALRNLIQFLHIFLYDIRRALPLAKQLFLRDFKGQYRQSALGYFWVFFPPVATTVVFVLLNRGGIISISDAGVPQPVFIMTGTLLWSAFLDALNGPMRSTLAARGMLTKVNFPKEALLLSGMGTALFNSMIRLILLIPIMAYYDFTPQGQWWLFPLGYAGVLLVGMAIGLTLTPVGILYTDIGKGLTASSQFWMLLTPVVYPLPVEGFGQWLAYINPACIPVVTARHWLLGTESFLVTPYVFWVGLAAIGFSLGWLVYRVALPHIVVRMGM